MSDFRASGPLNPTVAETTAAAYDKPPFKITTKLNDKPVEPHSTLVHLP
jgi:hypothetical protein